ncbi:MAG: glycosyl hydrolase-related protein [Promethearchaeia archaeon]
MRCYNLSSKKESATITFFEKLQVKNAEIVNLLEEKPKNSIKAEIKKVVNNNIDIELQPHVISTFKLELTPL